MNNQEVEPSMEVAHLRRLLDIQPSCLMRIGLDGTVLAASDAALRLIGAASVAEALGRDFADLVPPDRRSGWRAFVAQVAQGGPASIECEVAAPSGSRSLTLFHGVPIADHPDGVASLAVSARAVSAQRHLEAIVAGLEDRLRERDDECAQARERLAELAARQRVLEEAAAGLHARQAEPEAGRGLDAQVRLLQADIEARDEALAASEAARRTAEADRGRALEDLRQLEIALDAFASRQQQAAAAPAPEPLALSHAQAVIAAREAAIQALEVDRAAAQAGLEDARRVRLDLEAALQEARDAVASAEERERDVRVQCDALRGRLDEIRAMCEEREAAMNRLETSHHALGAAYASVSADRDRIVRAVSGHAAQLEALASQAPAPSEEDGAVDVLAMPDARVEGGR